MDDLLPLFIYVMSQNSLSHPCSELLLLEDYLKSQISGYETETMIITNLQASSLYISKDWDIMKIEREGEFSPLSMDPS